MASPDNPTFIPYGPTSRLIGKSTSVAKGLTEQYLALAVEAEAAGDLVTAEEYMAKAQTADLLTKPKKVLPLPK